MGIGFITDNMSYNTTKPRRVLQALSTALLILCATNTFAQDKGYDVKFYNIDLFIDRAHNSISGSVQMIAAATADLTKILQHCKSLSIDTVIVNNTHCTIEQTDTASGTYNVVNLPKIKSGDYFVLTTYYHGNPTTEGGANPWGGVSNDGKMMFAMGVGFSAPYVSCTRHWLPCYDLPDDKADSVTMTFITGDSDIVASNGIRTMDSVLAGGFFRATQWKVTHPIASYLLTFAVGPFVEQHIPNPLGIPFQCFSYAADSLKLSLEMNKRVVEALDFFDSLYGHYPFEKVGYVMAPIGSMEHQTMITLINVATDTNLSSAAGSASTVPQHELSHMWWGDRVTCKDFNDPWLNEGFATFSESLILERFAGEKSYWARQHANIAGAISSGSSIALYGAPYHTTPRNNYPYPVIYQKGAAVLGMLRYMLGDDVFFQALRDYGSAHAYANATSSDLESSFEHSTNLDLHYFFKEWVFGIWYPQLKVGWHPVTSGYSVTFNQTQDLSKYQLFRMPLVIEARTKTGRAERATVLMDSFVYSSATVNCSFTPDTLVIDPDGAVIKKIVGPVLLAVHSDQSGSAADIIYSVRFIPNPTNAGKITLAVNALPFVHEDLHEEEYYHNQRLGLLGNGTVELELFDTNGRNIFRSMLSQPDIAMPAGNFEEYRYRVETGSLTSGTYFAKVLLNNSIVGEGKLVMTH